MAITIIDDRDFWDKFIDDSPYGTIFHKWDFLKVVEKHSGYTLLPYGIYKGDALVCLFPLFLRKEKGLRFIFSPPPRTSIPYMGLVMSAGYDGLTQVNKESCMDTVTGEIDRQIKALSPNYVSVSIEPGFRDARSFKEYRYDVDVRYTYMIDVREPEEMILGRFSKGCKHRIKSIPRYDLTLKQVNDADTFYRVLTDGFRKQRLNSPLLSAAYLADLLKAFPDNVKMYHAYCQNELVGIEVITEYHGRLTNWLSAVTMQRDLPVNYFIQWELIKMAKARGLKEVEDSGANTERLCQHKSAFNPRLEYYFNVSRKYALGKVSELAYVNIMMKKVLPV